MQMKWMKCILTILSLLCILCVPVSTTYAAPQGTDGSELQVMEAEKLEIQFGADWAGVEFQLKTDAGLYPGTVIVGEDGVLRMELGGSSQYILSCMNSSAAVPKPYETDSKDQTQAPATTESEPNSSGGVSDSDAPSESDQTVAGIPVMHLIFFVGGRVLAIGTLIVLHVMKKRREMEGPGDEDDEE